MLVFPLTVLGYGALTEDSSGNSCGPFTEVDSAQPLTASPPTITTNEHVVGKLLNYDSTTGTGDGSFTVYSGGSCSGVTFDGSGATELSSGTDHLVVTKDGNRVDFVFTTLTDSAGAIGGFSISGVDLRQTRPEF